MIFIKKPLIFSQGFFLVCALFSKVSFAYVFTTDLASEFGYWMVSVLLLTILVSIYKSA
jgi:hypothetical protein